MHYEKYDGRSRYVKSHKKFISLLKNNEKSLYSCLSASKLSNRLVWGQKTVKYLSSLYNCSNSLCAVLLRDWDFHD